jgi:DNA-directed RNA polymerase specialized sigma subunit
MKTQPTPGIVGPLITSYLSTQSDKDFSQILKKYSPHITAIAGTFPNDWKEDYVQEGSIGLYYGLKRCPVDLPITELLHYINQAIRAKMIDFYRSSVGRFLLNVDVYLEDGSILPSKQPCIVQYPDLGYEDEGYGVQNHVHNYTALPEYASTLELGIDIKYLLANSNLQQLKLTSKEILAVDFHFKQGYNVSTVSKFLHTSVSNASKLITKANAKIKPYLLTYQAK